MGKSILMLGVLFGALGLLWSFLTFGIIAAVAGLGNAPEVLLISVLGFATGALAIAGGVVGRRRPVPGSVLLLAAGLAGLAALPVVFLLRPDIGTSPLQFLILTVVLNWWSYPLAVGGALGAVRSLPGRDIGETEPGGDG